MAPTPVLDAEPDRFGRRFPGARPGFAGFGALALHGDVEACLVHADLAGAQGFLRQVERKAVGVVKFEGDVAGQVLPFAQVARFLVEDGQTARESHAEARFLELQRFLDQSLGAGELGISGAHFAHQRGDQAPHQRVARAEHLRMPHRAAHDPAQDIAAAFIGRQHAVGDQKGGGAQMIGDDAVACPHRAVRIDAGGVGDGADQGAEQVDLEIGVHALHQGRDALQPHAGVDRRPGQGDALSGRDLLELHEDEVPEFEEAVAVLVRTARRAAAQGVALIVEDFRTGAARAGFAHRPEIVARRDANDAVVGKAGDFFPQSERLVVVVIDGDEQPILGEAEFLGDQAPGKGDRLFLEIISKGEVPEHLEEGVVPGGIADVIEIVVLAAGADAFLRGGGADVIPLFRSREHILERHHSRIGEHQRRIVPGHQ